MVLWTDLGVPTLAFDVYLTGYDVQTVNLRDLFAGIAAADGLATARSRRHAQPARAVFAGRRPFPGCAGLLPPGPPPAALLEHLRASHRGWSRRSPAACAGQLFGDQVARGYVTVDVARPCSLADARATPATSAPDGVAGDDNVLWGDFFYADPAEALRGGGEPGAHQVRSRRASPGPRTFYGRYVAAREQTAASRWPRVWAARFIDRPAPSTTAPT